MRGKQWLITLVPPTTVHIGAACRRAVRVGSSCTRAALFILLASTIVIRTPSCRRTSSPQNHAVATMVDVLVTFSIIFQIISRILGINHGMYHLGQKLLPRFGGQTAKSLSGFVPQKRDCVVCPKWVMFCFLPHLPENKNISQCPEIYKERFILLCSRRVLYISGRSGPYISGQNIIPF